MPGAQCCIVSCKTCYYKCRRNKMGVLEKVRSNLSFYSFPKEPHIRKIWMKRCRFGRGNPNTSRVCSMHFTDDMFEDDMEAKIMGLNRPKKLIAGAIPNRRLGRSRTPDSKLKIAEDRKSRLLKRSMKKDVNALMNSVLTQQNSRSDESSNFNSPAEVGRNNSDQSHSPEASEVNLSNRDAQSRLKQSDFYKQTVKCEIDESLFLSGSGDDICESDANEVEHSLKNIMEKDAGVTVANKRISCTVKSEVSNPSCELRASSNASYGNTQNHLSSCCEALRLENHKLKQQLTFFKTKLNNVSQIYQCAEEVSLKQLKTDFDEELKRYRNANAELTLNNSHYLNVLRSLLTQNQFRSRIINCAGRQFWTSRDLQNAKRLMEISSEAYDFLQKEMNIILPNDSSLNESEVGVENKLDSDVN